MSTPSSWPPPQQQAPQPYGPPQGQYPQQGPPVPYGQQLPAPYQPPPRPERPLMPGVWWSLVINLVVTVGFAVLVLVVGWAFVELISQAVGEPVSWRDAAEEDGVAEVVLVIGIVIVVSLLVCWLLTVGALAVWRLMRGFRTIPPFVQALVAFVTMWVVTSVLSFLAQIVFGVFGAASGSSTTY